MNNSATNLSPQEEPQEPGRPRNETEGFAPDSIAVQEQEPADQQEPSVKVCRKCSVQTLTAGGFCPTCGTSYNVGRRLPKLNKRVALIVAAVLIVVIAGVATALSVQHSNQVQAEQAAAASAAEAEKAAAEAESKRKAEASRAAAAAAAAQQAADDAKRTVRKAVVAAMEESIRKDAESRVAKGVLEGPITRASCTPLGGGSSDDLTAITGTFQCIAVNKTEADGMSSGYRFSSTVNWNDGSYSWHLGS